MTPFEDIFGETEGEIRADEDQWQREFAASREQLRAMAREAAAEFRAGQSKPVAFPADGRLER
jgi:hypothetical protein